MLSYCSLMISKLVGFDARLKTLLFFISVEAFVSYLIGGCTDE